MHRRIAPLLAFAVVWLAGSSPAVAAEAAAVATPAGPALEAGMKPLPRMLAGAVLKECVRLDEEIRGLDQALSIKGPTLDVAERDYLDRGRALDLKEPRLDRSDADAVARYNRDVLAHAAAIETYNALLPEFNALAARQNDAVGRFNAQCAQRPYYRKEWIEASVALHRAKTGAR